MMQATRWLLHRKIQDYPVPPKVRRFNRRWSTNRTNPYNRMYWRALFDEEHMRPSYWVSDFRHRHLVRTGADYQGKVPSSPQPGLYQGFSDIQKILGGHPRPQRESRHLPVIPMTARVVHEHRREKGIDFARQMRSDRRKIEELKTLEFWGWYMKLQRVRGRWCKEQGVSSRGVYGPAVDAAELWG